MGVDTLALLRGRPNPQQIAAVFRLTFETDVDVEAASDGMFRLLFADPEGRKPTDAQRRMMWVHLIVPEHDGKTLCSLGAFGGSVPIMEALARHFGGKVCDRDTSDIWRDIDAFGQPPIELSREDKFRLALERILGAKDAVPFANLVSHAGKLDAVLDAYQAYRLG